MVTNSKINADYNELSKEEINKIVLETIRKFKDIIPSKYNRFLRKVGKSLTNAIEANHRRLIVLSGSNHELVAVIAARTLLYYERIFRRLKGKQEIKVLYIFHDEFSDAKLRKEIFKRIIKERSSLISLTIARYEESERFLGTTFDALVMDLNNDLRPNDVGRLVNIVRGGGIVLLTTPPWKDWDKKLTIFKQNLLVPGYNEPRHIFISWFKRKLVEGKGIFIYNVDDNEVIKEDDLRIKPRERKAIEIPDKTLFPKELYKLALTQDQVTVINTIENNLTKTSQDKHKIAIVVTADRGRGKSCAVGISIAGLIHLRIHERRKYKVVVTAPSPTSVQSFFSLLMNSLETLGIDYKKRSKGGNVIEVYGERFSVEYWGPIDVPFRKADLVVVDEAAGIPVPMLYKIWRSSRRAIFATTIHGYEGAGRGFSVRFLSALKKDPETKLIIVKMHEPIRYAADDPIERWSFDALLLDAEPADLDEKDLEAIEKGELEYLKLDPEWLFSPEGEDILKQLFGIYVLAHYRNEPDDLGILADAPHHIIRALKTPNGKIVCAAQIAIEGGLSDDIIEELLRGGKIPGNIIPDRLLKHLRIKEFGFMRGWRIVRIATHPKVQGRGIGSRMLKEVYEEAMKLGFDWVGSGFGINEDLINFWLKNGFIALHMSPDRNPVSGEYTVLVMKPINEKLKKIVEYANKEFRRKLIESLHDAYRGLEPTIAWILLRAAREPIFDDYKPLLTPIQVDRLWIYVYGPMTYEAVCDAVHELAKAYWYMYPKLRGFNLSKKEELLLIVKALQGKSWEAAAEEIKTRPYTAMVLLKDIVRKFLRHFYGVDEGSRVGITGANIVNAKRSLKEML
ncbi:MAG: tRNA(Met) cytidine acetyltransferase TmcA [Pyrodictiaceae archaeon]